MTNSNDMASLVVGDRVIKAALVIFDKDGTLIEFERLWGHRTRESVEQLLQQVGGDESLRRALYASLGYDPETQHTVHNGPTAIAPLAAIVTVAATVLFQHGFPWPDAVVAAQKAFAPRMAAPPTADLLRPLGDVAGLFRQLRQTGILVAVVTTDDRLGTEFTLAWLDAAPHVSMVICGDDEIPAKPAPDAVWHVCSELGVEPAQAMVVGDSVADLMMATAAGVGCRVGVLSGVAQRETLAPHADILIDSIAAIHLL